MTPNVPLVAWLPDADPTTPGVMVDVANMLPTMRGYAPERDLGDAVFVDWVLPSACLGAGYVSQSTQNAFLLAGTSTGIYGMPTSALTDMTRSGGGYTVVTQDYPWRFDSIGDVVLALSTGNILQANTNPYGGGLFADVSAAPSGRTMAINNNFVMIGGITGGSWTTYYDGWWCSALADYTDWTPDVATQSARGRLTQTPGEIIRLYAYSNYIIAFKRRSMLRGTYVGGSTVWRWDVISTSVGLAGHDAIAEADGILYWLGQDGFYRFNGGSVQRINTAPWDWLANYSANVFNLRYTQAQFDQVRRVIRWYFPSNGTTTLTDSVAYHPDTDKWGRTVQTVEWVANTFVAEVYNASGTFGVAHPKAPIAFDNTHTVKTYSGDALASSFTTGDAGDDDGNLMVRRIRTRYLLEPTSSNVAHYYRQTLSGSLTLGDTVSRSDGRYDVTQSARWHRFYFLQLGNFELLGFSIDVERAGRR